MRPAPAGRLHPIGSRPAGEPVSSDANGTRNRPLSRVAGKRFSLRVSSRFASVYYRQAAPAGLVMIIVMTDSCRLRYLSCGGSLRLQLEPTRPYPPDFRRLLRRPRIRAWAGRAAPLFALPGLPPGSASRSIRDLSAQAPSSSVVPSGSRPHVLS